MSRAYLTALRERGHEVWWFANQFEGGAREETIEGIRIIRGGGQGTSIGQAIQWYRHQKPFNLVIDQHHGIPWFAPWWSRTKSIAYIHEVLGPIWSAFYRWPLSALGRSQERWTHWLYRKVPFWTPSESTKRALHEHGVREVKVLPNGTDTIPLMGLDSKPLEPPLRLIAVSRLAPNKRVDHAIAAVSLLIKAGVQAHLTIVGAGESEGQLRKLAHDPPLAGFIRFAGQLSEADKNAELRRAHFLVHTSLREGWGLNVIEANAMGTPAIVYPVGGLVDSTVHDQTGIVTNTEAPESVSQSLEALLRSPEKYERLRQGAWERSKTFQWSRVLPLACDWLEQQAAA
ncbi:Glycosyl transferase group 1 [Verrucomicrobia bacterium]|nr:Glycosyl transferase group 1 [Verrucomicrobiota bacterium]